MTALRSFLTGIKVLDLSQYIPGPMASLFLADMGAEVLKIEPPQGDAMRSLGPRDAAGTPVFYRALNGGKWIRRMDLKDPAERDQLLALVRDADVLVEGFRPGVMRRLGLDHPALSALNPRLVYCSLSGFGADGSRAAEAAHDGNYLALGGILDRNGSVAPCFFDPPVSDTSGALFAVAAILGALHGRARSGRGCHLDIGLADVAMPLQMMQIAAWGATGEVPTRRTTYLNGGAAYYQIYRTRDGQHVMLGAVEPKFWANFCAAAARPDWIARQNETIPQQTLIRDVAAYFASLDLRDAISRFAASDCCLSPVLDLAAALREAHVHERALVRRSPEGELQALFPAHVDGEVPPTRAAPAMQPDMTTTAGR